METVTRSMAMAPSTGMDWEQTEVLRNLILSSSKSTPTFFRFFFPATHDISARRVKISGTFEDVTILNSPAQAISLGNSAALVIDSVTVDNSAGDAGALGHNTDVSVALSSSISRPYAYLFSSLFKGLRLL